MFAATWRFNPCNTLVSCQSCWSLWIGQPINKKSGMMIELITEQRTSCSGEEPYSGTVRTMVCVCYDRSPVSHNFLLIATQFRFNNVCECDAHHAKSWCHAYDMTLMRWALIRCFESKTLSPNQVIICKWRMGHMFGGFHTVEALTAGSRNDWALLSHRDQDNSR